MQLSLIALGFLAGMGHALEPDHLAAVGAMATGRNSRRSMVLRGAAWGLGHTLTLLAICSAVILLGMALTGRTAALLESAVGFMLILLGGDVLWRMRKARVHFHLHDHSDGERNFHAHSHLGERAPHDASRHEHSHPHKFPLKALAVGLVHGAAGSAALLTLAVASVGDPLLAVIYVLLFGVGSIAGMAALSFIASWPLGYAERVALRLHRALNLSLAVLALGLGLHTIYANLSGVLGAA